VWIGRRRAALDVSGAANGAVARAIDVAFARASDAGTA
jgi:hypothetical protein